ncbi:MAG: AEC family transporter [Vulcanococcus sp.]
MLRLLLELGPCLLTGLWLSGRHPDLPERLAPLLLRWGVPISLVGLLLKAGLQPASVQVMLLTLAVSGGGLLLSCGCPALRRWLPQRSLQLGAVVGNTAYFGLPVAIALLPAPALSYSITYDLVGTLITWSLGPLLLNDDARQQHQRWQILWNSPVCRAVLVAIPLALSPWGHGIGSLLWWPARLVLLLMLLLVGMRLGLLRQQMEQTDPHAGAAAPLAPALLLKLLALPAVVLLLCQVLGLVGLVRDAVVLQAAAPTAMSVLLLAEASQQKGRETIPAGRLVLWSTLLALLSVPLWWWLLTQLG